jgi:hypothetical protein
MPVTTDQATHVAERWYAAWNSRSVDEVLDCFAYDAELLSPLVGALTGSGCERVAGRPAIEEYVTLAFRRFPTFRLDPQLLLVGAGGLSLLYQMLGTLVVNETLELDSELRIIRASAHFATALRSDLESAGLLREVGLDPLGGPVCQRPGTYERRPGWRR